ncbi:hypothetical protein HLB23_05305 [Nocardia uniformis]|uniref:Uncharacterized protein n=2 Tax=Nocardia uniformis TaxID=53432 RepID=A0A849BRK0_9NOCA|nr:hypothetical protein [Nocardia uniformis]
MLAAMRLTVRAPSVHNTQPWRWVFDGVRLHLYGDPERQLPATDPRGRQGTISCGAALNHARTAFSVHGWQTDVVRLPDPEVAELLATIRFHPWPDLSPTVTERARAIDRRRSDRLPLRDPRGWAELLPKLHDLVTPHDLVLDVLGPNDRGRLAALSDRSEAVRHYDRMYQAELDWWAGHAEQPDGIPPVALVSRAEAARVGVDRVFPAPRNGLRRPGLVDQARLVVLSSHDDTSLCWLQTGEALSALLLECTAHGLATCALTHVTELPVDRRAIAALIPGRGIPQVVVRIGTAPDDDEPPPPTPRRPLVDVFTELPA